MIQWESEIGLYAPGAQGRAARKRYADTGGAIEVITVAPLADECLEPFAAQALTMPNELWAISREGIGWKDKNLLSKGGPGPYCKPCSQEPT